MRTRKTLPLLFSILMILLTGCASPSTSTESPEQEAAPSATATEIIPTDTLTPPPTETPTPQPSPTSTPEPTVTPAPTETPDVPSEAVTLITDDGVDIAGTLFGEGDIAVLLLHMGAGQANQRSWHPFARTLAAEGFAALTIDFRGDGASGGERVVNRLIRDARAAVEFLQARGYTRLICMGASMGGTTCLRLAMETELEGVVVVASTMSLGEDNKVTAGDLRRLTIPKLFICGNRDIMDVVTAMSEMYRSAAEPKEEIIYDTGAHGTDLFLGPYGEDMRQQLLAFVNALR